MRLSPVANSPRVMVSLAVNGGFALLHSPDCIPGGEGESLAPDEQEAPFFSLSGEHGETSHHGAILTGTRNVAPSIMPHGEGGVTAGARTDVAGINRAGGGGRKCWDGKDRCGGLF